MYGNSEGRDKNWKLHLLYLDLKLERAFQWIQKHREFPTFPLFSEHVCTSTALQFSRVSLPLRSGAVYQMEGKQLLL
jgi:hypothetical protein